jgi:hypothetical protein
LEWTALVIIPLIFASVSLVTAIFMTK